jgi:DNA-binding NtrC family response regulator
MIELVSENRAVAYRDLRYLVVDDDDDQRFLLVRTLNRMGMANVVEAASGRAALEVLAGSKQTIDIVISDLQMPDVDGMELVRRIGERTLPVSVILVSALDDVLLGSAATMTQAYGVRIIGTIGKPITREKLFTVLRHYVPQRAVVESSLDAALPLETEQVLAGIAAGQFEPFLPAEGRARDGTRRGRRSARALAPSGLRAARASNLPAADCPRRLSR